MYHGTQKCREQSMKDFWIRRYYPDIWLKTLCIYKNCGFKLFSITMMTSCFGGIAVGELCAWELLMGAFKHTGSMSWWLCDINALITACRCTIEHGYHVFVLHISTWWCVIYCHLLHKCFINLYVHIVYLKWVVLLFRNNIFRTNYRGWHTYVTWSEGFFYICWRQNNRWGRTCCINWIQIFFLLDLSTR